MTDRAGFLIKNDGNTVRVAGEDEPTECKWIRPFRRARRRSHQTVARAHFQNPVRANALEVAPRPSRRLAVRPMPTPDDGLDARPPRCRQRAARKAAVSAGFICAVFVRIARAEISRGVLRMPGRSGRIPRSRPRPTAPNLEPLTAVRIAP